VRPRPAAPRLRYRELPQLPRLAWLAVLNRDTGDVLVYHGSALECREHWMVEGTWDGDFQPGGFHESDHFFGSGIRVWTTAVHIRPVERARQRPVLLRAAGASCWSRTA